MTLTIPEFHKFLAVETRQFVHTFRKLAQMTADAQSINDQIVEWVYERLVCGQILHPPLNLFTPIRPPFIQKLRK